MDNSIVKAFDYEGNSVAFKYLEGVVYVNVTQMAKPFGKRPNDYMAQSYVPELVRAITSQNGNADFQPVITVRGTLNPGTWMCEDMALDLAQWLSMDFRVWCLARIKELMTMGITAINYPYVDGERIPLDEVTRAKIDAVKGYIDIMRPNDVSKQIMLESVLKPLGIEMPAYVQSKGVVLSATDNFKELGYDDKTAGKLVRELNPILGEQGYLVRQRRTSTSTKSGYKEFWVITEKGLEFGENDVNKNNQRSSQPLWYKDKFKELLTIVGMADLIK